MVGQALEKLNPDFMKPRLFNILGGGTLGRAVEKLNPDFMKILGGGTLGQALAGE